MDCINTMIPGWMTAEELAWLHCQAILSASVVEIGCWKGRSTYALLSGCNGPVYAIDHFKGTPLEMETNHRDADKSFADFMSNVGWFPNLRVLKMPSADAVQQFIDQDEYIDMVFIDGDHAYDAVLTDIKMWAPRCKKILCGHDSTFTEVQMAIMNSGLCKRQGPGTIWYAIKGEGF